MLFDLLAVLGLLSLTSSQLSQQYHFVNIRKNWIEAQRFCREKFTDLVTVQNGDETKSMLKTITDVSNDVYIGLYRKEGFSWHWCMPDTFYNAKTLQNLKKEQPDDKNKGCTGTDNSNSERQFVCYTARNNTQIQIEKKESESGAQQSCKNLTDLINSTISSENPILIVPNYYSWTSITNDVWIGLFKDDRLWLDQKNSCFCAWSLSQEKHNSSSNNCKWIVNEQGKWNDAQCNDTLSFICYGDLKPTAKPDPLPTPTSGQKTTTSGTTTLQDRPTQNTIEGENTNIQTTQMLSTGQEQDNLILVNDNLTWTEAASYCRKHHVDLISIHSEELQNRATRKAIQASSSHVWMGLRYTCRFNFWFWIKNREAGCYQNWASGHGPHGFAECGLSGAMESTGAHRWFGRLESDRLNFICHTCAG
ncbi:macrophage mannose receptor 1 [Danio aesculapii]|uniref:macrophage mannose receptor 1 n=1 Tax=Danio aesculapii TaxID=1142201 RepID=UPI0024C06FA8|nr:macrophage mannose receptor 1 [Danio aesculapii]